ncbi:methylcobamide:CoM methyltransferase MtaA [Methanonatronarchaeum sp. AMET6-2]|uniref:methylcobamide:CoM methyltransferase MtaA n=1 Tax=Methanonatronarchaeum sp. AMET6-2 TaxID=2933293 RepID=UPI0011F9FBED|nr:methylcobamide:CoM methyltransferase MtaA [Methanonatronarchaeum sp. AMET6-2]RZN62064.1 MAG: MtaA/CmuA family methyltransferase [Methanonatronarchaeia archaeon]UOY09628.1 methylcobamide:CoM methyltransferase MtaA [Methanonatronarchaeum sp. AMET6-2]
MDVKQNLMDALKGEDVDITPVASVTQTGTEDLMERSGAAWPEAHSDPQQMFDLAYAAHELGGLEAVRMQYCLTVQAEALGAEVDMGSHGQQPSIEGHPYEENPEEFELPDNYLELGRIPKVIEAVEIAKEKVGDDLAIMVGFAGPTTLASHLTSTETFMKWFLTNPEKVDHVLEPATEATIQYAQALNEAGADILCVCDPVASPELLSPQMFEDKLAATLNQYADEVDAVNVLHICGDSTAILDQMVETGFEAISIEEKVDVQKAKSMANGTAIVGTVSTANTMLRGEPDEVKAEAKENLDAGIDVLAPSCGIAPGTPLEAIQALVEARDEYFNL